ncbi:MAG: sugar phosphate isomerase/epimerase family protein, partial [Burkholderiales bacterium]
MPDFGLNGATTGEGADLETDIRAAAQAGYQFLELRDTKIERYLTAGGSMAKLRSGLRVANVLPLSVNALEGATPLVPRDLEPRLARMRTLCEWARALGAPYVVAVPGFLPPDGAPDSYVRMRATVALRALASVAAPYGVEVGFEFLGFPRCAVNTLSSARGILEDTGDPRVGLVIDAFHFYAGGSRVEDLAGLDGARVFVVHLDDAEPGEPSLLNDAQRLMPGDGVIPLKPLVARLQAIGYRGAFSLE